MRHACSRTWSLVPHLDKPEDALDDLAALGPQQHEHRGQQVRDRVGERGRELV